MGLVPRSPSGARPLSTASPGATDLAAELVRDEDELRHWILDGGIERLVNNRPARFFMSRQRLQMPAYREALTGEDLDAMMAYMRWLRGRTP